MCIPKRLHAATYDGYIHHRASSHEVDSRMPTNDGQHRRARFASLT